MSNNEINHHNHEYIVVKETLEWRVEYNFHELKFTLKNPDGDAMFKIPWDACRSLHQLLVWIVQKIGWLKEPAQAYAIITAWELRWNEKLYNY